MRVEVHPSQFPERVAADLAESFRTRRMNHKFHYDSVRQAARWLALHEQYSPACRDDDCQQTYDRAFQATAELLQGRAVSLFSIGCGGGQKDTALLQSLGKAGCRVNYTPGDVSLALALTAHQRAVAAWPGLISQPVVFDLAATENLPALVEEHTAPDSLRLLAFFGMMPNFEPLDVLPKLAAALRPGDGLILSANLAPGRDYLQGIKHVLPLYDNAATRLWLVTVLNDAGLKAAPEEVEFSIEESPDLPGLQRIEATWHVLEPARIRISDEWIFFATGERFRLFFSYRHNAGWMNALMEKAALRVEQSWITASEEEGVFLCRPAREGKTC